MVELNLSGSGILIFVVLYGNTFGLPGKDNEIFRNQESAASSDPSWYRLSENVVPNFYELWILPQLAINNFTYEGRVNINLRVFNETNTIIVHNDGLSIQRENSKFRTISNETIVDIPIFNQEIDAERQFYIISFATNLSPGSYNLSLSFFGQVLDDVLGFYRSSYVAKDKKRWLGITQFSPTFARRAFPCFDEPYLKATYQLHIGHYGNETVTGNTVAERTVEIKPDYFLTSLAKTPPMSTYLVGWAIHDFKYTNVSNFIEFGVWTRENMKNCSSRALDEGIKIYNALNKWINVENPVKKMEQIAVPDFYFNAMENWGLVTFRESVILWEDGVTSTISIRQGLGTIAHEYAHTWFGNLVTPKFWNVAWLKEGFASFFAHYGLNLVHDDWRIMDIFGVEVVQSALHDDSNDHNRTMNGQGIGEPKTILAGMDFVTYKKGASIIRMINHVMGDWAFHRGLQSYVKTLSNKSAIPDDLYEHLQKFADQDIVLEKPIQIRDVVETWANQPGYPLVTVVRNYSTNVMKISQERFYLNRSKENADVNSSRWWIPVDFTSAETRTDDIQKYEISWIRPRDKNILIPIANETYAILCNNHQVYYYRVNYDETNWQRLINHLNSNAFGTIHSTTRASLLDDSFNLAKSEYIDYSIPLNLSRYLVLEYDYEPWLAATNSFQFLDIMLSGHPDVHRAFQMYVNSIIQPIYENVTFEENPYDQLRTKLLRDLILATACSFNNVDCLNTANSFFQEWILDIDKRLNPDTKRSVYCAGLRSASPENWEKVLQIFFKTELHTEQELLISGLGCTNDPRLINEFLNYTLYNDSTIRKQYRLSIFNAVLNGNPKSVENVLDYLDVNFQRIVAQDKSFLSKIFDSLKKRIVLEKQLQKLTVLVEKNIELLSSSLKDAQKAIKFAEENIAWIKIYAPRIAKWLN